MTGNAYLLGFGYVPYVSMADLMPCKRSIVVQKRDAQTMLEVYDVAEMVAKGRRPVSMPGEGTYIWEGWDDRTPTLLRNRALSGAVETWRPGSGIGRARKRFLAHF